MIARFAAAFALSLGAAVPALANGPSFSMPIKCEMGTECFVQYHPDWSTGAEIEAKDYRCGPQANRGKRGTNIRLRDIYLMQRGVPVIAAADGIVVAVREGRDDAIVMTPERRKAIQGTQCGNNVILAHGKGWRTQYCHMRQGSITVKAGDQVPRGAALGLAGSSGESEYPQLEFLSYYGNDPVDPFAGRVPNGKCGQRLAPLWTKEAAKTLNYRRGSIMAVGFSDKPMNALKAIAPGAQPGADAPALVAYANLINLEAGDILRISLMGPGGVLADNQLEITQPQAHRLVFNGRKRSKKRWPAGVYSATIQVIRSGKPALLSTERLTIDPK